MAETKKKATTSKAKKGGNVDKEAEKMNAVCHEIDLLVRPTIRSKQTVEG